ncbi:hypothetical protein ACLK2I_13890 [Escherichia coli]
MLPLGDIKPLRRACIWL